MIAPLKRICLKMIVRQQLLQFSEHGLTLLAGPIQHRLHPMHPVGEDRICFVSLPSGESPVSS